MLPPWVGHGGRILTPLGPCRVLALLRPVGGRVALIIPPAAHRPLKNQVGHCPHDSSALPPVSPAPLSVFGARSLQKATGNPDDERAARELLLCQPPALSPSEGEEAGEARGSRCPRLRSLRGGLVTGR